MKQTMPLDQIRLIAIDLDGTLLNDDKEISPANHAAVQACIEAGYQIVVCTGRTLPGSRRFIEALDLPKQQAEYAILYNGAASYLLPDYQQIAGASLAPHAIKAVVEAWRDLADPQIQLVAFDQDHFFLVDAKEATVYTQKDAETLASPIIHMTSQELLGRTDIIKLMAIGPESALDACQTSLEGQLTDQVDVVRSQPIIIEFLIPGVNKATALMHLADRLNLIPSQVLAIGDQLNDLEMLEWAGYSVAMGNAHPQLQALADQVTLSNNDSGVAHVLHQLL